LEDGDVAALKGWRKDAIWRFEGNEALVMELGD
jgi:hypothetical protein